MFSFLLETYSTERLKTLSVWSQFDDRTSAFRPAPLLRTPHEHMVHQCVSENHWMKSMLGIDLREPPLPKTEARLAFLLHYADASARRLAELSRKDSTWFQ